MFTALLKVPIQSKKDSFFHVRKNGNLVQTLHTKHAILIHKEKPKNNHSFGETYAFFLIDNVKVGDSLRSTKATFANGLIKTPYTPLSVYLSSHYIAIAPPISFDASTLYQQSTVLEEVCFLLHKQGKLIPKSRVSLNKQKKAMLKRFDRLLALSLPALFSKVIKADIRQFDKGWFARRMDLNLYNEETPFSWSIKSFDSATILKSHIKALEALGKPITDYVSQETIDNFLLELIREFQFEQYICFAQCPYIKVSEKVTQAYAEAYSRYTSTLVLAIGHLKQKCSSGVRLNMVKCSGYDVCDSSRSIMSVYESNTPCGSIQISIDSNCMVTLSLYNGTGSYPTARFDMTDSCTDFSDKIYSAFRFSSEQL